MKPCRSRSVGLLLALAACGAPASDGRPRAVEEPPPRLITVDTTADLEVGVLEGPPEYMLNNVIAARTLSDGRMVLTNSVRGYFELRYYDGEGRFLTRAGRYGEGPWEVAFFDSAVRLPGDTLLVVEVTQKFSTFGPGGERGRTGRFDLPVRARAWRHVEGSRLAVQLLSGDAAPTAAGVHVTRASYGLFDTATGTLDTLAVIPDRSVWVDGEAPPGTAPTLPVPYSPSALWAAGQGSVWIGTSAGREVTRYDATGAAVSTLTVGRGQEDRRITPDDLSRELEMDLTAGGLRPPIPELQRRFESLYRNAPLPRSMPLSEHMQTDALGRLWVLRYQPTWEARPVDVWDVYEPEGGWVAVVRVPLQIYGNCPRAWTCALRRLLEIGTDHLLVLHQDELGVARVRRYRWSEAR